MVEEIYQKRISDFETQRDGLVSKSKLFPFLRLATIAAAFVSFYFLFSVSILLSIITSLLFITCFIIVVRRDVLNEQKLTFLRTLININENEILCLKGNYNFFHNGQEFINYNHPYSSDLDVFGNKSLFQLMNRTTTHLGRRKLAESLLSPLPTQQIKLRQDAAKELGRKLDWRQQFYAIGRTKAKTDSHTGSILNWLKQVEFIFPKITKLLVTILPIITLSAIILSFYYIPAFIPFLLLVIHWFIFRKYEKPVSVLHNNLSGKAEILTTFSEWVRLIEVEDFKSAGLQELKNQLQNSNTSASQIIRQLSGYSEKLDFRFNVYFHYPLNLLFFRDIKISLKLEKWKQNNASSIPRWFDALSETEVICSIANLHFNNPDWCFPEIAESNNDKIIGIDLGHPIIEKNKRIVNDLEIKSNDQINLITGSNMAGKSTYLRTIGVNMILAFAGCPVCAKALKTPVRKIFTSMRITDSLQENASSFYAELNRIHSLIKAVKDNKDVFFLLDEILRGTNSHDRHIGSKALIKQLLRYDGSGLIATHDLELSKLEEELKGKLFNYSFDVQVKDDLLYFDYKLHKGVCRSLNASILMKKMGIEIE